MNISTEKLKHMTCTFNRVLECPICLDTVKVPLKQCATGHILCSDCVQGLATCPTCQREFTLENPVSMKNLLEALPRPCRYSDGGCEELFEPGDDHETFCGFRPMTCRQDGCAVNKPLCQLLTHYEEVHPLRSVVRKYNNDMKIIRFKYTDEFNDQPVHLFDNLFWISKKNDVTEKQLMFEFEATPNGRLEDDFYVRVELKNDEFVHTCTLKAGVVGDCDNMDRVNAIDNEDKDCMRVAHSALKHLIDKDGTLVYKLSFFKVAK